MQTNLPIQVNTAGSAGQRNAVNGGANAGDGSQFSAMLSNEMERGAPAPAPAPAPAKPQQASKPQQANKPQEAAKPAQPDDGAAKPTDAGSTAADATANAQQADDAGKADAGDEDASDGAAAPADPASAMLALMASLQKPADEAADGKTAADAAGQAYDSLTGARGKRSDAGQLAALQAALKSTAKETGADGGKALATGAAKNPALAAAGLGTDDKAGAAVAAVAADTTAAAGRDGAIDLRALQGAVKADAQAQPEVEFTLQQARDAALLATQKETATAAAALAPAQPASLAAVQAAAASEQLTARVGTTAWENQVGQKVVYMVGSEEQTASLTLNPPDLGPMQVVLSVSNDQTNVTFSSNELEVRQALQDALPRLREMMDQSGITLGNATVNAGMPDGSQARDQSARNDGGFGRGNRGNNGGGRDDGVTVGEATVRPARVATGSRGAVDTFA
nr:flagellar hook-length control protein FliK [uncultured Massilia sp.]